MKFSKKDEPLTMFPERKLSLLFRSKPSVGIYISFMDRATAMQGPLGDRDGDRDGDGLQCDLKILY